MPEERRYPFLYTNSTIYVLLLAALVVAWFAFVGALEVLLYRLTPALPKAVVPVVFLAGLFGGAFLIRRKFRKLYILHGEGILFDDHFEINLGKKAISIPFDTVKRIVYHDRKRNRGLIISAKGNSLYVEEALHGDLDKASLHVFFEELNTVYNRYKRRQQGLPEGEDDE